MTTRIANGDGSVGDAPGNPWHEGERAMHRSLGIEDRMAEIGPHVIRSSMPDQHRDFFGHLPFIVVGSNDDAGQPWASVLAGPSGFVSSPDAGRLKIDTASMAGDALGRGLRPGAAIGVLGIELPTRRRNRANGHVISGDAHGFEVAVEQSFGNCPKYIVRRTPGAPTDRHPGAVEAFTDLPADAAKLIRGAATFFIATSAHGQVDVSHRGGRPGFVEVDANGVLTVPDYSGNYFFNTIGNLLVEPRAGLVFIDFTTGDVLQLTGAVELIFDGKEVESRPGAQRLWRFETTEGSWLRAAFPLGYADGEISPFSPPAANDEVPQAA